MINSGVTILTKFEAVNQYGSNAQKEHFNKYKKFTNKNLENSLIKTLKQYYENVEVIKQGRSNVYKLSNKRDVVSEREDGRINNGKNQLPFKYEQMLPIMIIDYLSNNKNNEPLSINNWLMKIGFITEEMFRATMIRYNQNLANKEIDMLVESNVIKDNQEELLRDYIDREISRLQKQFLKEVKRLDEAKVIKYQPFVLARCEVPYIDEYYNNDGHLIREAKHREEYLELNHFTISSISNMIHSLQNSDKYKKLSIQQIYFHRNLEDVQKYWNDHNALLNQIEDENGNRLYIVHTFNTHGLFITAGDNQTLKFLEKNYKDEVKAYKKDPELFIESGKNDFHNSLYKYVVDLAQDREDKFQKRPSNNLKEILGGKSKDEFLESKIKETHKLMLNGEYGKAYKKLQGYYRNKGNNFHN